MTWEEYGLDYVHPTPLGHEIITSELLNLFQEKEQKENVMEDYYPETPAFLGAFRNSYIMDLSEKMVDTKPGDVILDTEITMKMMLMEFWQDSIKNEADLVFMLDGQKVCGADAYASMAWGNPVCQRRNVSSCYLCRKRKAAGKLGLLTISPAADDWMLVLEFPSSLTNQLFQ